MRQEAHMKKIVIIVLAGFALCIAIGAHARPPKPGHNFIWVAPHTTPSGHLVPGHWKYVGPAVEGKVWVPGHRAADGTWVNGHWKAKPVARKPHAVWVKGHFGPRGRWIPGHWRYR